jgi:hypothetical protein
MSVPYILRQVIRLIQRQIERNWFQMWSDRAVTRLKRAAPAEVLAR